LKQQEKLLGKEVEFLAQDHQKQPSRTVARKLKFAKRPSFYCSDITKHAVIKP
jgi:hypothetical protein